jgi:exosortase
MSQAALVPPAKVNADQQTPWLIIAGLTALLLFVYWETADLLMSEWAKPQYSHGFLIPLFTVVLLSIRRQPFVAVPTWERWCGVAIIAAAMLLRTIAAKYYIRTFDSLSLPPALMGVFVVAGGFSALRWAWAPLLFLVFMFPLPNRAEIMLLSPLQHVATVVSNYVLQTLGVQSYYQGNHIFVGADAIPLNVAEACSGLRMGTIFFAMGVAMAMIIERPIWERAILVASGVPIGIIANVLRIVVTALLYVMLGAKAEFPSFFHDHLAAWFMMPIAFGILYLEYQLLSRLFIEEPLQHSVHTGFAKAPPARKPVASKV